MSIQASAFCALNRTDKQLIKDRVVAVPPSELFASLKTLGTFYNITRERPISSAKNAQIKQGLNDIINIYPVDFASAWRANN